MVDHLLVFLQICDSSFASSCVNIHEWRRMKWDESAWVRLVYNADATQCSMIMRPTCWIALIGIIQYPVWPCGSQLQKLYPPDVCKHDLKFVYSSHVNLCLIIVIQFFLLLKEFTSHFASFFPSIISSKCTQHIFGISTKYMWVCQWLSAILLRCFSKCGLQITWGLRNIFNVAPATERIRQFNICDVLNTEHIQFSLKKSCSIIWLFCVDICYVCDCIKLIYVISQVSGYWSAVIFEHTVWFTASFYISVYSMF
jgi:hypothetical protein